MWPCGHHDEADPHDDEADPHDDEADPRDDEADGIGFGLLEERLPRSFAVPYPFLLMLAVLAVWFAYTLAAPLSAIEQAQFPTVLVVWLLGAGWVFVSIFGQSREDSFEWWCRMSASVHCRNAGGFDHIWVCDIPPGGKPDPADVPWEAIEDVLTGRPTTSRHIVTVGPPG
jgi:hypothetical protein